MGCREENTNSYLTAGKATQYFKEIEDICIMDNGKLWGQNLYGPIIFVERTSRKIFANFQDAEGILKGKDGIYTGLFPKELIISNAPIVFGGTQFAMVPLPAEEDAFRIRSRAIHGLFHRLQERYGIPPALFNIKNMDEKEARLWIKLEWKALRKALDTRGQERMRAIRDALIFRGSNRELYQTYAGVENRFETYEGLATFTFTKMCTSSDAEFREKLLDNLERIYTMPSYARSYGYIHGALYASLLCDGGFNFSKIKTDTLDLGNMVKEMYKIELPVICRDVAGSLALSYDVDVINREEEKRLSDIQERLHSLTSTFTEKTVVYLELESPSFDFEPENIHPVDTLGTLYSSLRVSDNWGKLTVDKGGCLVSGSYKYLRVTAKGFQEEKNRISGEGWNLLLNAGWEFVEVDQNHFLRKVSPL